MKSRRMRFLLIAVSITLASTFSTYSQVQNDAAPWAPPTPRLKASRVFSPKPLDGHNVFRDEADLWLAEAIIKLEVGNLDIVDNKLVNEYVTSVGMNLAKYSKAPEKTYKFIVVKSGNSRAFTPGGGLVYISLDTLCEVENEDELAGIIAHEIGHDAFAHAGKAVTRQMFWLTEATKMKSAQQVEDSLRKLNHKLEESTVALGTEVLLGFSRFAELEADKASFYNLHKAGYNPRWWRKRLERWKEEQKEDYGKDFAGMQFLEFFLGSHPPTSQRVTALKWEANWVEMPPRDTFHKNAAFNAVKRMALTL